MYVFDMPRARLIIRNEKFGVHYHCVSRVVDRNFVFGAHERDVFRKVMRQVEEFSGVRVVTWTILSNHFHVLLEVPPRPAVPLSDEQILDRCRALYSRRAMVEVEWDFQEAQRAGGEAVQKWRGKYLRRMWDLSEFMKTLKQKFTVWFNRHHQRVGTLWESRYKSVIVEGAGDALCRVAAYIDLNAVRAGLVEDPKDYRWCGYAEAVAGDARARKRFVSALGGELPRVSWREVGARYRKILFGIGEQDEGGRGISRQEVAEVWRAGGKLSAAQLLRCRGRYLTDGLAIGSAALVEEVFATRRSAFGEARQNGARKLAGGDWGGLCTARALRVDPLSIGGDG